MLAAAIRRAAAAQTAGAPGFIAGRQIDPRPGREAMREFLGGLLIPSPTLPP